VDVVKNRRSLVSLRQLLGSTARVCPHPHVCVDELTRGHLLPRDREVVIDFVEITISRVFHSFVELFARFLLTFQVNANFGKEFVSSIGQRLGYFNVFLVLLVIMSATFRRSFAARLT
jgi:hypothetical protein